MRSVGELIDLVEEVGPYIAALKTHVDMVDDFQVSLGRVLSTLQRSTICYCLKIGSL